MDVGSVVEINAMMKLANNNSDASNLQDGRPPLTRGPWGFAEQTERAPMAKKESTATATI